MRKKIIYLSFISGLFIYLLLGFTYKGNQHQSDEIMTMVVEYKESIGIPYQKIIRSQTTGKTQNIILLQEGLTPQRKIRLFGSDKTIIEGELIDRFDQNLLVELIKEASQDGWTLLSHNFSVGKSSADAEDSIRHDSDEYISYYLFKK